MQLSRVALLSGILNLTVEGSTLLTIPHSKEFWFLTLYLAVFCTIFAFYAQMVFIRKASPSRVGLLMGMEPVFGAVFSVLVGGGILSMINWIRELCIVAANFLGRYLLNQNSKKS
ncbi:EamA family transporter [Priestia megaterium]|nr:EamA family transporter [Priestia megaterium]